MSLLAWPVVELLLAYMASMRSAALEAHRHAVLVWAVQSAGSAKPSKPPKVPRILE